MAIETSKIKSNLLQSIQGLDISQGEEISDRALNFPNVLTLLRIALTPFILMLLLADEIELAFYFFAFAAISDFLDGWYAKKFKARTRFGAFLDPLADKILIVSMYFWMGLDGWVPNWFVVLIISRDVFILIGMLITWIAFDRLWVAPLAVGKLTTLTQLSLVGLVFIDRLFAKQIGQDMSVFVEWSIYTVAAFTLLSVVAYVAQWFVRITIGDEGEGEGR